MTEFGMATNIGCAAFSITIAPAIAVFFLKKEDGTVSLKENAQMKSQRITFVRDVVFIATGLGIYAYFSQDGSI